MGNTQTNPPKTYDELSARTHDTRYMVDEIFEFMIKKLSIRDFVELSDSKKCDKYVLFKANALYKYFHQIQVIPTRNASGIIAFRTFSDLIAAKTPNLERQSLCLIIAYYYTRIFQIYGALALTLIDDVKNANISGMSTIFTAPGFNIQKGGAHPDPRRLEELQFLIDILTDIGRSDTFQVDYTGAYTGDYTIRFILDSKPYSSSSIKSGVFKIYNKKNKEVAYFSIRIKSDGLLETIEFGNIYYKIKKKPSTYSKDFEKTSDITKIQLERAPYRIKYKMDKATSTMDITGFFNMLFDTILPKIKDLYYGEISSSAPTSKIDAMDVKSIIDNLKIDTTKKDKTIRPRSHCVARALQLLKTIPLAGQGGESFICKFQDKSGLPVHNKPITSSPGFAALANLFYDTIQDQQLKIGTKSEYGEITLDKYIEFMKKISKQFDTSMYTQIDTESKKASTLKTVQPYISMSQISNKREMELCNKIKSNDTIILPPNVAGDVKTNVINLFKIQYEHAANCGFIFNKMFKIQRDKATKRITKISLSDDIYRIGFPEIQSINNYARQVLVNYYSNCENEYLLGVQKVINSSRGTSGASAKPSAKPNASANANAKSKPSASANANAKPKPSAKAKVNNEYEEEYEDEDEDFD